MRKSILNNNAKGITLIALIITIIVMLILAGVTINLTLGDNGIFRVAQKAGQEAKQAEEMEQIQLAALTVQMKDITENLTQEQKREMLEQEIKKHNPESTVTISDGKLVVNHGDKKYEVNEDYDVSQESQKEIFDSVEWDATAAMDAFVWGSDDPTSADYGTVIGYTANAQNYPTLRFPSRCTKISIDTSVVTTNEIRSFTQNIKEVELPETVVEIGTNAFYNAGTGSTGYNFVGLKKINIPISVIIIGNGAFYGSCLTEIIIPDSVTAIGTHAFSGSDITEVDIPDSVTEIGASAFSFCFSLKKINIPDSITEIPDSMLLYCNALESVTIPEYVTKVGEHAFSECVALTGLHVPNSVIVIGQGAFSNVPHIQYNGTAEGSPWGAQSIN